MTQAQLSEKIQVSEQYVRLIENGYKPPSVKLFQQICMVLDIPAYNLLQNTNEALRYIKPNFCENLKSMDEKTLKKLLNFFYK